MTPQNPDHPERENENEQNSGRRRQREPINLRKAYPLALRSIFRRSIVWILSFIILLVLITMADMVRPTTGSLAESVFFFFCTSLLVIGALLVIGKLIYECVYFHVYYYGIELEHLVISRGLFYKTRATFPLARLTDVYAHQTPMDLAFMLYNLRVTTPSPVAEYGAIDGLSQHRAVAMQNFLSALANTTSTPVDEEAATDAVRQMNSTEDPSIFGASPEIKDPPRMPPQELGNAPSDHGGARGDVDEMQKVQQTAPEEVLEELKQTKLELRKTRRELEHAEDVLEKAQDALESAPGAIPPAQQVTPAPDPLRK